jgi:hypothetical protein
MKERDTVVITGRVIRVRVDSGQTPEVVVELDESFFPLTPDQALSLPSLEHTEQGKFKARVQPHERTPMPLPAVDMLLRVVVNEALTSEADFAVVRDRLQCLAWHKFHQERGCSCMCALGHTQDQWVKMQRKEGT